jgi:hypothetical protein
MNGVILVPKMNPFRKQQAVPTLTYFIGSRRGFISEQQLRSFTEVFEAHTAELDRIENNVAANIVKVTGLPDTDLETLWDLVRATIHSNSS